MNKEQLVSATTRRIKESKDAEHKYAKRQIQNISIHFIIKG